MRTLEGRTLRRLRKEERRPSLQIVRRVSMSPTEKAAYIVLWRVSANLRGWKGCRGWLVE